MTIGTKEIAQFLCMSQPWAANNLGASLNCSPEPR